MFRDLQPGNWPEDKALESHALVGSLLGDGFAGDGGGISDEHHLDEVIPVEKLSHVVDADSSQARAIEEVRRQRHLIIQGPPGTGKSQTITNLIATAVLDGKTVLFVAEKLAALEVVKRRLDQAGLGPVALELHSHRANKREVLDNLKKTLGLGSPSRRETEQTLERLRQLRGELNGHAERVNVKRAPCGLAAVEVMGRLALLAEAQQEPDVPSLVSPESWTPAEYEKRRSIAEDLRQRLGDIGIPSGHAWYGVGNTALDKFDIQEVVREAGVLRGELAAILPPAAELSNRLGLGCPDSLDGIQGQAEQARMVGLAPELDRNALKEPEWAASPGQLKQLAQTGASLASAKERLNERFAASAWATNLTEARSQIAAHGGSLFRVFCKPYRRAMESFRAVLRDPNMPREHGERLKWLDDLEEGKRNRQHLDGHAALGGRCFGSMWAGENSDWGKLASWVSWTEDARHKGYGGDFLAMVAGIDDRAACGNAAAGLGAVLAQLALPQPARVVDCRLQPRVLR